MAALKTRMFGVRITARAPCRCGEVETWQHLKRMSSGFNSRHRHQFRRARGCPLRLCRLLAVAHVAAAQVSRTGSKLSAYRMLGRYRGIPGNAAQTPQPPFTLPAPDGKASVLHTDMTRLDPGREYQTCQAAALVAIAGGSTSRKAVKSTTSRKKRG